MENDTHDVYGCYPVYKLIDGAEEIFQFGEILYRYRGLLHDRKSAIDNGILVLAGYHLSEKQT